jgi:uncharacterized protein YndB with AHSA1/START domain
MNTEMMTPDGIVTKNDEGLDVIAFERRLSHPIDATWAAITEPDGLIKWWGAARVDLVEGGEYTVRWLNTDEDGNAVMLEATVTELDPMRALEVAGRWASHSPDDSSEPFDESQATIRFELAPDGDGTLLRFINTLDVADDQRTSVTAGWHYHLDALATALAGGTVDLADPWAAWEPIHEAYVAREG